MKCVPSITRLSVSFAKFLKMDCNRLVSKEASPAANCFWSPFVIFFMNDGENEESNKKSFSWREMKSS